MTPSAPRVTSAGRDHPPSPPSIRPIVGWLLLAITGLGGFAAITVLLLNGWVPAFDQPLLDTAKQWQSLALLWRIISESANIPLIVIGVGMVLVLFFTNIVARPSWSP